MLSSTLGRVQNAGKNVRAASGVSLLESRQNSVKSRQNSFKSKQSSDGGKHTKRQVEILKIAANLVLFTCYHGCRCQIRPLFLTVLHAYIFFSEARANLFLFNS